MIKMQKLALFKHEIVLASLLILLFGQLFIPVKWHSFIQPFLFAQTFIAGIFLFYTQKTWRTLFLLCFSLVLATEVLRIFIEIPLLRSINSLLYIFFFISISVETYRQIFNTKKVGLSMIIAVFSGFILLCFIASLLFLIIENQTPFSFSNLGSNEEKFQNINYFSFITALTIGYGDIVPLTQQAKKAVMLVSLLGNFYSVFVTGTVIGKYINKKSNGE
ncbi:ion channel [Crocinitomix algicola]|uniref:ion channel n=1 Tax=Crocinitomix algicola TaxID=1740263 RepID=UPI001C2F2BE8|nr:ion channel [Crocinitomix algicola]